MGPTPKEHLQPAVQPDTVNSNESINIRNTDHEQDAFLQQVATHVSEATGDQQTVEHVTPAFMEDPVAVIRGDRNEAALRDAASNLIKTIPEDYESSKSGLGEIPGNSNVIDRLVYNQPGQTVPTEFKEQMEARNAAVANLREKAKSNDNEDSGGWLGKLLHIPRLFHRSTNSPAQLPTASTQVSPVPEVLNMPPQQLPANPNLPNQQIPEVASIAQPSLPKAA